MLGSSLRADDTINRLAADALKAWQAPAVAVCVVQTGQPTLLQAWGVRELGSPVAATVDDVFPIASCSKAFTTALMAQLVDEGKLGWDDPVRKHLPGFHLSEPHADALVNLRDLLTHRTGVNGHDMLWYHSRRTNEDLIKSLAKLPLSEPFRAKYQYSTLMYIAAGQAAANAAGQPWHAALQEKLILPLGMKSVTYTTTDPAFQATAKLTGHRRTKTGSVEVMPRYEITAPNPAGSINLSLRDLEPWLRLHLQRGECRGKQLVSARNLGVTHTPQMVIPFPEALQRAQPDTVQLSYGMGWIVGDYRGVKTLAHGGMIDGFRTIIYLVPDRGLAFAIVCNLHETKLNLALANQLLDHYLGLPPKDWNAILLKVVADEQATADAGWKKFLAANAHTAQLALPLADYAGTYTNPAYGTAKITVKDEALHLEWSSFQSPLVYWGDDGFHATTGFLERSIVEFKTVDSKVQALRFQSMIFARD